MGEKILQDLPVWWKRARQTECGGWQLERTVGALCVPFTWCSTRAPCTICFVGGHWLCSHDRREGYLKSLPHSSPVKQPRAQSRVFPPLSLFFSPCFLVSGTRLCYGALVTSLQFEQKLCLVLGLFSAPAGSQVPSDCQYHCFHWPLKDPIKVIEW